jgi:PAS domain S-box-containing protein
MSINDSRPIPLLLHDTTLTPQPRLSPVVRYALAVVFTGIALMLSLSITDNIRAGRFIIFFPAVILSAWFGGPGPGLLSAFLSLIAADYFLFAVVTLMINLLEARRQRSERTLDTRTNWLQTIVNSLGDGIVVRDAKGNIIMMNRSMVDMMGYTSDDAEMMIAKEGYRQRFSLFTEDGKPLAYDGLPIQAVIEQGKTVEITLRGHNNDTGEDRWYELKTSPIRDVLGNVQSVVSLSRDVTELRHVQQIEQENQTRIGELLNNIPALAALLKPDGEVVEINQVILAASQLQPSELIGKNASTMKFWDDSPALKAQVMEAIREAAAGKRVHFEASVALVQDSQSDLDVTIAPLFDADHQVKYLIASGIDITERKHKEREVSQVTERLVAQEARLRLVLNNVPAMIWEALIVTGGQPNIYVNEYATQMLGYERAAWEKDPNFWNQVIHPDDLPKVTEAFQAIYQSSEPGRIDMRCVHKNGRSVPVEAHIGLVRDEKGQPVGVCGVLMDITERKHYETKLARQAEALARSNADLRTFAYAASHDLQEPLRMITSYIQLIEQRLGSTLTPEAQEFMGFVIDGAARMKLVIADLLAYSRLQNSERNFKPVALETALEAALASLQMQIKETEADITHTPLPNVIGSETQLTLLFQNLLSNAIKFNREKPRVEIGVKEEVGQWVLSVRDNGIGIEAQFLERIFGIFQRLHTKDQYPGTGLGLAICKRIVENHQGRMWVESTVDVGTTFYFSLPTQPLPMAEVE